jgi:hypothetical protein
MKLLGPECATERFRTQLSESGVCNLLATYNTKTPRCLLMKTKRVPSDTRSDQG